MPTWYRTDTSRLSWGECWRLGASTPILGPLILFGGKLLGKSLPCTMGNPRRESLDPVPEEMVPSRVLAALRAATAPVEPPRGDLRPALHHAGGAIGATEGWARVVAGGDGLVVVQAFHVTDWSAGVAREKVAVGCLSRLADGTIAVTAGMKRELDEEEGYVGQYVPGAAADRLLEEHRRMLRGQRSSPVRLDARAVEALVLDNELRSFDARVRRGLFVPLTEAEMEDLKARTPPRP